MIHLIPVSDFPTYDETPDNAIIFATTGIDGCHYCMAEDNDEMNIYIVFPNMGERSVYLIGHSISEMISYALSIQGLFECIFDLEKDDFLREVEDVKREFITKRSNSRFTNDLLALKKVYPVTDISASEVYDKLRMMNCS